MPDIAEKAKTPKAKVRKKRPPPKTPPKNYAAAINQLAEALADTPIADLETLSEVASGISEALEECRLDRARREASWARYEQWLAERRKAKEAAKLKRAAKFAEAEA